MRPAEELFNQVLSLRAEIKNLEAQVAWYQRQMFGARSEKLPVDTPNQAKLGLPEAPVVPSTKQTITYERRTPSPDSRPMPAEVFAKLPVTETVEIVPEEVKAQPASFEKISEERTCELDIIGPRLVKRELVRPKFRRKDSRESAPLIAPALPRVAAGGYAAAGLIAYLVISKYQHHLPLHRIDGMSAQSGAQLSRKTMADWVRIAADWAEPIYKRMHAEVLASGYVQCDETPIKFIDPDEKGSGATQGIFGS